MSNVPQTPKFVNASFVAFFQDPDLSYDIAKELTNRDYSQSHLPLTPRRKPRFLTNSTPKGLSLDQLTPYSIYDYNNLNNQLQNGDSHDSNEVKTEEQNHNSNMKKNPLKFTCKQASLDSKIEHIFEEAEEVDASITNGETTGLASPENE